MSYSCSGYQGVANHEMTQVPQAASKTHSTDTVVGAVSNRGVRPVKMV